MRDVASMELKIPRPQHATGYAAEAPSAAAPAHALAELTNALASGLLLAVVAACGRFFCPWLFFIDDFQAYYLPALTAIGRSLRRGEFPLLTPTSWIGGNFVGEYQFAIFNPLLLILSLVSSCFRSIDGAALSIVLPCLVFLGFAVHHAARSFDIETSGARTAALMVGLGNYLLVWCASSWVSALYSLPFLVLLWSFLHRYVHRGGAWYPWVLCVAGLLTAGWPYSVLAGAALSLIYLLGAAGRRPALLGGAVVGGLLGSVAILPLVEYSFHARRASAGPVPDMLRVSWEALITSFVPLSASLWQGFDGAYVHADRPIGYLNVFLLFLVPAMVAARLRAATPPRDRRDLEYTLVFFLLLVGVPLPAFLHWPARFLPVLHVFLSLACLRWWMERRPSDELSRLSLLALVAFGVVLTLQQFQTWDMISINAATLAGAAVAFGWAYRQRAGKAEAILCGYTVLVFLLQMYWYQDKVPMAVWGVDDRVWTSASSKLTLSLFTDADLGDPELWNMGTPGNVNLLTETPAVNGYSPLQIDGTFSKFFAGSPHSHLSATAPDIIARLRENVPGCDQSWFGVLGVERLLIFPGQQALVPEVREWLRDWRESRVGSAVAFEHLERPPLVACLGADLVAELRRSTSRETVLSVVNRAQRPRRLVLRRQWFPGYRAWLDGAEVPVRAVGGVAVGVMIPANRSGLLAVRFAPRSLEVGFILLGMGIVGLVYGMRRNAREPGMGSTPVRGERGLPRTPASTA